MADNNIFADVNTLNWGDTNFGDLGAFGANLEERTDIRAELIVENFVIKGYIAPRKNTVSISLNETAAKEAFEEELKKRKEKMEAVTLDGKEIKSYSQKNLKFLKGEDFVEGLKGHGHYRMNIKEAKAEYYVLGFIGRDTSSEVFANLSDFSEATSIDNQTVIIKPRKLFEQITEQKSVNGLMPIVAEADPDKKVGNVVGLFSTGTGKSSGKMVLKTFHLARDRSKVTDIGYLPGVVYAVNKRYEGEVPPENPIVIENATFVDRYDPTLVETIQNNPSLIRLTIKQKDLPIDAEGNKVNQEIPYSEYADRYGVMGVTEDMLEQIRKPKSSRKSTVITLSKLKHMYEESRAIYQQYKKK